MEKKILQANVTATKIEFDNGIMWEVNGVKYGYGWALSKNKHGRFYDNGHIPVGTKVVGDVMIIRRVIIVDQRPSYSNVTVFQPHDSQFTDAETAKWSKDNWVQCFGDDKHYYADVESVTYKDPKTKKERTDKCYGISIQKEVNVIVWRKNGKRPTTSIPIENVVKRHLKTFAEC